MPIEVDPSQVHSIEVDPSQVTAAQPGLLERAGNFARDFGSPLDTLKGIGAGAISTGVGAYKLARKIPGADQVLPAPSPFVESLTEAPQNFMGKAGKLAEQGAEFLAPLSKVGTAMQLARAPIAAKLAAEAGTAALTTGVQTGGDTHAMGVSGLTAGALSGAGAGLAASARNLLKGGSTADLSADLLRRSGEKEYAQVLNPTTKGNKLRTARVVPELIDRGVTAFTRQGLANRAADEVEKAGQALGDAYDQLPANASIPLKPVADQLKQEAGAAFTAPAANGQALAMSPVAKAGLQHVEDLVGHLRNYSTPNPTTGEAEIPVATARRLRQYYDQVAKDAGRYDGKALADQTQGAAHGMAADAIRGVLADEYPDIAALNKEFSFWSDVNRVTQDTLLRKQGQAKGLGQQIANAGGTAAGAVMGGLHGAFLGKAAMTTLEDLTTSPAWRTVGAVWKDRLADAIASGQQGKASFLVNKIAQQIKAAPAPALPPAQDSLNFAAAPEAALPAAEAAPEAAAAAPAPAIPQPGDVLNMSPHDIEADPVRFQFKRDTGGKAGVGDELKSVQKYDPELGGVLSVWRDPANGKTYVVNGHHRLELAQRADAPHVSVRYLDAADATEARTRGALINMAEGRGTAIDAAKVLRDSGITPEHLEEKGISLKGAVARDGSNLSQLSPRLFDHVLSGELPVRKASLIGELLPAHGDQQSALDLLGRAEKNGKHVTDDQFRELVSFVKNGPKKEKALDQNLGLFGDSEPEEESAALEMAGVSDYIRKRLMSEKKLFSTVADVGKSKVLEDAGNAMVGEKNAELATGAGQHLAVYDKLKANAGSVNDTLRNAAQSLGKKGAPANEIKEHAYQRIRAEIAKTLGGGSR